MSESSIFICSIVRDCDRQLKSNIPRIELLRNFFLHSKVVVFENDSKDNTKLVLGNWQKNSSNVFIKIEDFNQETIPETNINESNRFYSTERISKMVKYRNQYLRAMEQDSMSYDFVLIIDLDIEMFSLDGIADSFGLHDRWDAITANGQSYSKVLKKRYHDTYALIELGNENQIHTEQTINDNQQKWSFMRPGMPLIPVYSAFGGLAIFKSNLLKNIDYKVIINKSKRVPVHCEHVSLFAQIHQNGYKRVLINPNMAVWYEKITLNKLINFLNNKISQNS